MPGGEATHPAMKNWDEERGLGATRLGQHTGVSLGSREVRKWEENDLVGGGVGGR